MNHDQGPKAERPSFGAEHWHPRFVNYLFIAFTQSSTFGPRAIARPVGKNAGHGTDVSFAEHCHTSHLTRSRCAVKARTLTESGLAPILYSVQMLPAPAKDFRT